jgi:hypothetical protein
MSEKYRPQPEKPKQNAPEPGTGPLGKPPPPGSEQTPQGGGGKSPETPRRQIKAQDLEILTLFQQSKELLGKLPHPLAPEFKEQMINDVVEEEFRKINWEEMQRQIEKMDEELDEALEDPIQRRKLLEDD